ncbi:hydroxysqualene dehydroxylase HpnE [Rugamonas sp.]|uniref:hydroxysqualene dehydroxylase HpnE n=1 Tax=Rugamonas sp. TaxID=1926287 RepID=UPI0025E9F084|nr:hydroxysqualene dehydroxylase HpnE [Rugamonas sp.]
MENVYPWLTRRPTVAESSARRRVAVVGAGWAGCAAAVELARAGHAVTVFEAARTLGGRARGVEFDGKRLDNGQHILLGAYRDTLRLMRQVGIATDAALLTLPLQMRYPPGSGGMDFIAPRLPAPLHLLGALLRATGLERADKLSLARFSTTARWMDWRLYTDCSVSELLQRFGQTPRLVRLMWRPLCLAALNTPPERASAQIFLNVLRDSLGASRAASDMLLPRVDLSALFPAAAAEYVVQRGGRVLTGARVDALHRQDDGRWRLDVPGAGRQDDAGHHVAPDIHNDTAFDGVVLATAAGRAATLLHSIADADTTALQASLQAFTPEAITTCYLQYDAGVRLRQPFYALLDDASQQLWGQFVFDRGQLDAAQAGLLAVVISAAGDAAALDQPTLAAAIAGQLAAVLGRPELARPLWQQVITEKRATHACAPGLVRPANASGLARLAIAGDYTGSGDVGGDYPATLEAAVRSGIAAAAGLWSEG